ncbi:MAG: CHAT domain-containing protein [Lentimicrobium sp.]|jgi:CHAT domain-containing protein|nr:CHAT domain-containing protein [Lentimicrobium sp.]
MFQGLCTKIATIVFSFKLNKFISASILFLLLVIPDGFTQYGPLYWKLRGYDSIPDYRKAMLAFSQKNYSEAFAVLDSIGNVLYAQHDYDKYYLVRNEKGVMKYITQQYEESSRIFDSNLDMMISNQDTLNYEFAIALRIKSYLANNWDGISQPRIYYLKRQYSVLKQMGDDSPIYIDCLGDLGLFYMNASETALGINYLLTSNKLAVKHELTNTILINDHTITNKLSVEQPYLALEIFENQFKTASRQYYRDSTTLIVLAYTIADKFQEIGNYTKAIEYFNQADFFQKATTYPHLKFKAAVPLETSACYSKLGDYNNFKLFSGLSLQAYEQIAGNRPFPRTHLYSKLAEGFLPFNADSSLFYLEKALKLVNSQENPEDDNISVLLELKSRALMKKGLTRQALNVVLEAINLLTGVVPDESVSFVCNTSHVDDLRKLYLWSSEVYLKNYLLKPEIGCLEGALKSAICCDTLTRILARKISDANALLDYAKTYKTLVSEIMDNVELTDLDPEIILRFVATAKAFQLMSEIDRFAYAHAAAANDSLWQNKLMLDEKARLLKNQKTTALLLKNTVLYDSLEVEIRNCLIETIVVNYSIIRNQTILSDYIDLDLDFSILHDKPEAQQLVLDIFQTDKKIILFGLNQEGASFSVIQDAQKFDEAILAFQHDIKTGSDHTASANRLSQLLLQPMADKIARAGKITFIPDKTLLQIPLEVLPEPKTGRMLIENHAVSYNYSLPLWKKSLQKTLNAVPEILAIAPVYKNDRKICTTSRSPGDNSFKNAADAIEGFSLTALPYSEIEVKSIDSLFRSRNIDHKLLLNEKATKSNLFRNAGDYNIIHIASHGLVSKDHPELSGIFLSQGFTSDESLDLTDNGFLHVGELTALKTNANLVVLSTCNSGAGALIDGEGVLALPRSLIFAGVPNVIASLWKVNDLKTSDLMLSFYQHLLNGDSHAEALRQAKLECISRGFLPVNWAGFVLIGN